MTPPAHSLTPADKAQFVRGQMPAGGLFAGQDWRIAPDPFPLEPELVRELETLGRILLQFYRAANLLYRQSAAGKEPGWVADWLDKGKPGSLIALQRSAALKNDIPRVIRPDLLLLDHGVAITELDSVPGGIGLTAWLNKVYSELRTKALSSSAEIVGGADGMLKGFESIFGRAENVHIVVSNESGTYRPEMEWISQQIGPSRFHVRGPDFDRFAPGDAVYRFFELFDSANVANAGKLFELASQQQVCLTPPPKPIFEEKMLFGLLWNRNLRGFWRRELGEKFLDRLLRVVPYTWVLDPAPLPPQGAVPELNLTDWQQLKALSQKERDLILKVSGFDETAWGARGVYLGSDLSLGDWSAAVDLALREFERHPYVLQRFLKPTVVDADWFDFTGQQSVRMKGRVRLCPFYFVAGEGDAARAQMGGVLATVCPAEKKIIHGMSEAILSACSIGRAHEHQVQPA